MNNDIRPGVGHGTAPSTGYGPFNNPPTSPNPVGRPIDAIKPPAVGTPMPHTVAQPSAAPSQPTNPAANVASSSPFTHQATSAVPGNPPVAHQFGASTSSVNSITSSADPTGVAQSNTFANSAMNGATPSTPSATTFANTAATGPTPPMTTRRKSPLKWILIIGIPLIIIIGIMIWYLAVFNNKYNVVRNALYSIMGQRDNSLAYNLAISSDDAKAKLAGTMKYLANSAASGDISINIESNGTNIDVGQIAFASDGSNAYLKLSPSKALAQFGLDLSDTGLTEQWIELSADTLESSSSSLSDSSDTTNLDGVTQCLESTQDLMDDRANQQQIVDALLDTDFLVVGNSDKDDHGTFYELSLNGANFAAFYNRLMDSNYMQSTLSCLADNGIDADTDLDDGQLSDIGADIDKINPSIKFWIKGTFSHQLTRVQVNMNVATTSDDVTASMTIDFDNQTPTIEMPADAMTLQEIVEQNPTGIMQLLMLNPATIGNSSSSSNTGSLTQQTDTGSNVIDFTLGEGVQIVE